ncbi:hypothetical protein EIN_252140 [Entamoeba invadens IP1]|uniref:Uncharacterized protein n=1 Tax=Entamoeba invadens IP1 TaxID=370355 RepID=A0A0A1UEL8_ENTIV|nr:hypothetical protein EIN_252140 [Entamoeba invadens IP1]ELP95010.1 hypothetical protein EIN_252140 [Entamoeba invadens IP1]|eukprot:XP_004261781.1 hypothetical protein EIN_252140 [Entamoeba invadens IP1]
MLSTKAFYICFSELNKTSFARVHPIVRPCGGYYMTMTYNKSEAILFETFDEDTESKTFRLRLVEPNKTTKQTQYVNIDPFPPNNIYISTCVQLSVRFRLQNKRFECLVCQSLAPPPEEMTKKISEYFFSIGEVFSGKHTKYGQLVVINCAQHFLFKENLTGIFNIGTYAVPFKPIHYVALLNEIPNVDVIPGTPYFKAIIHQNFENSTCFKFKQGVFGFKIEAVWLNAPSAKTICGEWWLKVLDDGNVVFGEEKEADEFCISGGRLDIIKDGKIRNFVGLGERRDEMSFFLATCPLDLLTFRLEIKALTSTDGYEHHSLPLNEEQLTL